MSDRQRPPVPAAKSPKNSRTSPRAIAIRERMAEALEYRRAGHSYRAIADQMGMSFARIREMVVQAMAEITAEPAEAVRTMEIARCDELMSAIYADAIAGDLPSINMVLRIQERRARLFGLDKLTVQHTAPVEIHTQVTFVDAGPDWGKRLGIAPPDQDS
jgi:hypothetical protein